MPNGPGLILACAALLAAITPVQAQPTAMKMPGIQGAPGPDAAMQAMTRAMAAVPMTGNADRDFAAMMLPHHQGAIDMARYELAHGHNPAMRSLAQAIVAAQKKEMAVMQAWLAAHPAQ